MVRRLRDDVGEAPDDLLVVDERRERRRHVLGVPDRGECGRREWLFALRLRRERERRQDADNHRRAEPMAGVQVRTQACAIITRRSARRLIGVLNYGTRITRIARINRAQISVHRRRR